MKVKHFYEQVLEKVLGESSTVIRQKSLSGGCINNATRLTTSKGDFCIKWNQSQPKRMFETEFIGLDLMIKTNTIKIPKPIGYGSVSGVSFLLLEFIESAPQSSDYWELLGRRLAQLHQSKSTEFGLTFDNYMGSLPQANSQKANWVDFFVQNRLLPQFRLAIEKGLLEKSYLKRMDQLAAQLPNILIEELPSLIHGDLWNGNLMVDNKGEPCIIDPAIYYGNREVDLAMTKLFGGFSETFYQAYLEVFPIEKGLVERIEIYNLYPLLIHVNLFGLSYKAGIDQVLRKYS